MKRWDVYQDGKWVDGIQARDHSEAVLEALRKLDLDDESGLEVLLSSADDTTLRGFMCDIGSFGAGFSKEPGE
ncbi:hypothetical protein [Pseudomonas psychrophila]|uniref:Uncharacterized protein n=1 Tax=Pseudomonas psychrophila TaxID=122355 RepID=A0A8I1FXX8_9PSED|nr:hypothetical protein [Pseudomonas psychrophila]AVX93338.1 hypothetical protein PkP19E3_35185 [Pseudomonas koreensis]MBJ2259705.1 hypothetical protein [Pseudomonas psychrophila]